jgi:hypothetical protein
VAHIAPVAKPCIPAQDSSSSFAHAHVSVKDTSDMPFPKVHSLALNSRFDSAFHFRRLDGLVEQERLANVFYLGYCALEIKGFGQDDLEDLQTVSGGL